MEHRRGRPKKRELTVSEEQRSELARLASQMRSSRAVGFRARIILGCAGGLSNVAVAKKLRTTGFTVGFWRNRFIAEGIAGLGDEPRAGHRGRSATIRSSGWYGSRWKGLRREQHTGPAACWQPEPG